MIAGSGCTPRTVRYYEREGLLRADRSVGGHRLFPAGELDRLRFIVSLREAGWALEDVEALLAVRDAAPNDAQAWSQLHAALGEHVARIEAKIALLNRLREDL